MRNRIHANRVRPACPPPASGPTAALPAAIPNAGGSGGSGGRQGVNSKTNWAGVGGCRAFVSQERRSEGTSGERRPGGAGHLAAVTSALDFPTGAAESLSDPLNLPCRPVRLQFQKERLVGEQPVHSV